jgi:MFS family permease
MDARGLLVDVQPLRDSPAFRRFWVGQGLSAIGTQLMVFAVALQVFTLTHSSLAVGAVGLCSAVPQVAFALLGGAIGDAVDRRRLVIAMSAGQAGVSGLFALQAYAGLGRVWVLYALTVLQALIGSVNAPAKRTFVPRLLPKHQIAAGAALTMFSAHLSATAGPGVRAVVEALRFVRTNRIVAGAFLADLSVTLLGMPFALFPAINAEHFGGRPQTLGLLVAAPAVGGVLGSALSGPVGRIARPGRAMLGTCLIWGATTVGFGLTHALWAALALLVVAGTADVTGVVLRTTMVQIGTPDRYRGRVSAAELVVGVAGPQLGGFRAGLLGTLTSPTVSAVAGGVSTVVGALLVGAALPTFVRYRVR